MLFAGANARRIIARGLNSSEALKRAATSIVLNIAEGSAEYSPAEKARLYRIALRSGAECHAACAVMVRVEIVPADSVTKVQTSLEEVVAMLVTMCKKMESRLE